MLHVIPEPIIPEPVVFVIEPVREPDAALRAVLIPGLPARLDNATHRRCLATALAAVGLAPENRCEPANGRTASP
jgi:hypothetical protein